MSQESMIKFYTHDDEFIAEICSHNPDKEDYDKNISAESSCFSGATDNFEFFTHEDFLDENEVIVGSRLERISYN